MAESERPKWTHKTNFEFARWLNANYVTKITHHWKMTGCDTSEDWIELHSDRGGSRRGHIDGYEVVFAPNHAGLVRLSRYVDDSVRAVLAWEKQNERDLAELARLRDKLGV